MCTPAIEVHDTRLQLILAATGVSGVSGERSQKFLDSFNLLTPAFGGLNDRLAAIGEVGLKRDHTEVIDDGITERTDGATAQLVAHRDQKMVTDEEA